jgi:hypothetical protein
MSREVRPYSRFYRQTLTRLATEYGIALREGPQDYKRKGVIDRDWLLSTANMARWAHLHQIPLRPRGGGSHDSALRVLAGEINAARPGTRLLVGAGLEGEQFGVEPAGGHELAVGAAFGELPVVKDGDEVGHAHGGEAVGDEHGDAAVFPCGLRG